MAYYPLMLEMKGRRCLVIGGGEVATRKVEALLAVGAAVSVVSPKLSMEMAELVREGRIEHTAREYVEGGLRGFDVCIGATDDAAVNGRIADEAKASRVLLNVVDRPDLCDFVAPAVVRKGDVVIAVSTGGASPAFAGWLRLRLERQLGESMECLERIFAEIRRSLLECGTPAPGVSAWDRAVDDEVLGLAAQGRMTEAKSLLQERLGIVEAGTEK